MWKSAIVGLTLLPVALGAQSFSSLSPAVQPLVTVSDARVALTHVRVVDEPRRPI